MKINEIIWEKDERFATQNMGIIDGTLDVRQLVPLFEIVHDNVHFSSH
jgi:hypothetical protein